MSRTLLASASLLQQIGQQVRHSTRAQLVDVSLSMLLMMLVVWTVADPTYHGYMHGHRLLFGAGAKGPGSARFSRFVAAAKASTESGLPIDHEHLAFFESFHDQTGEKQMTLGKEAFDHHPILHASDPHSDRYHEDVVQHHPHNRVVVAAAALSAFVAFLLMIRAFWMRSYFQDVDVADPNFKNDPEHKTFLAKQMALSNPPSRATIVGWNVFATFEWVGRLGALVCLVYANLAVYSNFFSLFLLFVCGMGFLYHWSFVLRQISKLLEQHSYLSGVINSVLSESDPRRKNF